MDLRTFRRELGLTRAQAASGIGCSAVTIWRIETGKRAARADLLASIVRWAETERLSRKLPVSHRIDWMNLADPEPEDAARQSPDGPAPDSRASA